MEIQAPSIREDPGDCNANELVADSAPPAYEAPALTEVGSVHELTLNGSWCGPDCHHHGDFHHHHHHHRGSI